MPSLLKTSYVNISNKDKRIIDMNALMEAKLEKMRQEKQQAAQAGFVPGLNAEVLSIVRDPEDGEGADFEGEPGEYADAQSAGAEALMADNSALLERANEEAAAIIEEANNKAKQIIDDAVYEGQNRRQAIFNEAESMGYADGMKKAGQEIEQAKAEFEAKGRALEAEYVQAFESIEAELVETITDIYQYIFDVQLSDQRQILVHLIENTLRKIEGTRSFLIHVSAEDAAFVSMQKKNIESVITLPDSIVEIIEDIGLSKNQCFIETDGGIFDCGLDTELTELTQKLRLLSYEKKEDPSNQ